MNWLERLEAQKYVSDHRLEDAVWDEMVALVRAADADHYGDECECHGFAPNGTHDPVHNALAALKAKVESAVTLKEEG